MTEYEEYERKCRSIRKKNETVLDEFTKWLRKKGLADSTAMRHSENIDFYINDFLLHESPRQASEGVGDVGMFLGYWFIRKAMWASAASIKANAASLKKFYDFMLEQGEVDEEAVKEMKDGIKEDLPEWVATLKRYDDPSLDSEDVWQW